jgi:dTDP-4-dehydrorhamnose 3,5-epimerase
VKFRETPVPGAWLVEPEPWNDERGYFARAYCRDEFRRAGLATDLEQANVAWNRWRGTVRGLHYQRPPDAEAKLIRCVHGAVFVVLLDLRRDSPAFARPWTVTLRAGEPAQVFVPERVATGYQSLDDSTELYYLMSASYRPDAAAGIRYDDPRLAIPWPLPVSIVSARDRELPLLDPETMGL